MNKKIIVETKVGGLNILESYKPSADKDGPILGTFEVSDFIQENTISQNRTYYESALWETQATFGKGGKFVNDKGELKPATLAGSLDHPNTDDASVRLQENAIMWRSVKRNDNGSWSGQADILNTPMGRITKTHLDYAKLVGGGEVLGISLRGLGESEQITNVNESYSRIIPETFELMSLDFVYDPSFRNTAVLTESRKANRTMLIESVQKLAKEDKEHKDIYEEYIELLKKEKEVKAEAIKHPKGIKKVLNERYGHKTLEDRTKSMIVSIIAYHRFGVNGDTEEILKNEYLQSYIEEVGDIGLVRRWVEEVKDSIERIEKDVYTDNEGVTYNSVIYKEPKVEAKEGGSKVVKGKTTNKIDELLLEGVVADSKKEYIKSLKTKAHKIYNMIFELENMTEEEFKELYKADANPKDYNKTVEKLKKELKEINDEVDLLKEQLKESVIKEGEEEVDKDKKVLTEATDEEDIAEQLEELDEILEEGEDEVEDLEDEVKDEEQPEEEQPEDEEGEEVEEEPTLQDVLSAIEALAKEVESLKDLVAPVEDFEVDIEDIEDVDFEVDEKALEEDEVEEDDILSEFTEEELAELTEEELEYLETLAK